MDRHKFSRLTVPKIVVKYNNLGDFGGTVPVEDMWTLEVSGPTYEYRDVLSRLGLRWNPTRKTWGVEAILYKYSNARRSAEWARNRKIQTTAYPQLVELAKAHNAKADEANSKLGPANTQEKIKIWQRVDRMLPRLNAAGIQIERTSPNRYEVGESQARVRGNTYPIRALMVKYGFRWDSTRKEWVIPGPEFTAVGDKWMSEVVRSLPEVPKAPAATPVFSNMSNAELTAWVMDHDDMESLTQDGEIPLSVGVTKAKRDLRRMSPEDQEAYYNRAKAGRRAGVVLPFTSRVPKNTHTILIAGVKYVLSTHWPGVMGDLTEDIPEMEGGARVIRQEGMDPWKYLWAYDTDKQILAMWRVSDGNNKEWGSARTAARTILLLEKKGQLNRVDNTQFRRIEAEMSRLERESEASLEKWVDELKTDFQRRVDVLVQEYFDTAVRPVMDRAVANVDAGAVPIGFKATGGGFPVDRQMKSFVTSRIYDKLFNLDKIDAYVQSHGVDLESGDIQATQWAQGDVWMEYARSVLR